MDIAILTSLVVGALTPFFKNAASAIGDKAGSDLYEHGKHLYEIVRNRFAKETDGGKASKALQNFAEDPEEYRDVFEKRLINLLQNDPAFANTLRQIVQAGPRQALTVEEEAAAHRIRMTNTQGRGNQEIMGGKRSRIEDVELNM
jgi:hypothetical protein